MSDIEPLSAEGLELLERARAQREGEHAPGDLRARVLERARAEALRADPAGVAQMAPPPELQTVSRPALRAGLRLLLAAALFSGLVLAVPWLMHSIDVMGAAEQALAPPSEPTGTAQQGGGNWQVSGPAGALLSRESPLFRLPLLPLEEPEPAPAGPSLLADGAFSERSGSWQVRRWNDPKESPSAAAAHEFRAGALCVKLGAGDRVIGGFPWPAEGVAPPPPVPLVPGRGYRLGFRAWAQGPLPSQVLIGVGHTQFPFIAAAAARVQVSSDAEPFAMDFVAARADDSVGVAFLATNGARADATELCLAEVVLRER